MKCTDTHFAVVENAAMMKYMLNNMKAKWLRYIKYVGPPSSTPDIISQQKK